MAKKEKEKELNTGALLGGMAAPTVIGTGAVGLMGGLGEKDGKHTFEEISRAATGKVRGDLEHKNMGKLTTKGLLSGKQAPHYMPGKAFGGKDTITSPTSNTAVTAHELGHSSSKFVNSKAGNAMYGASKGLGSLGAMAGAWKGAHGEELSNGEKATALGVAAPMLYEESRANLVGAKASFKLGGGRGLMKALPSLIGLQASYMAAGASPIITNYVARKIRGDKDKTVKKKKN